jgi:MFS family permease
MPNRRGLSEKLGIAAAITCITIAGTGLSLGLLLISFVLDARGVSGLTIGLIATMGGLATVIVSPLTPSLIERIGLMPTLVAAIVLMALSFGSLYWIDALWLWFVLRFLNGIAIAVLLVSTEFWINSLIASRRRGLVLGIYTAAQSIGFAAGPALLAAIPPEGFWPFAVGSGLMLLAAIPALAGASSTPRIGKTTRGSILTLLAAMPTAMLAAFTFGAIEGGMNLLPIYGLRVGKPETVAALLATAVALGNVVFQLPIGFISDRIDRHKVLLACGVVALTATMLIPFAAAKTMFFFGLLVVWGGVVAALYSVGLALVGSHYHGAALARANATFVMLYSIGRVVGPAAAGAGIDLWNPHGFALAMALFVSLYVAVAGLRIDRTAQ